eukprot:6176157-Pleurochrysis_carterae.AAC.1
MRANSTLSQLNVCRNSAQVSSYNASSNNYTFGRGGNQAQQRLRARAVRLPAFRALCPPISRASRMSRARVASRARGLRMLSIIPPRASETDSTGGGMGGQAHGQAAWHAAACLQNGHDSFVHARTADGLDRERDAKVERWRREHWTQWLVDQNRSNMAAALFGDIQREGGGAEQRQKDARAREKKGDHAIYPRGAAPRRRTHRRRLLSLVPRALSSTVEPCPSNYLIVTRAFSPISLKPVSSLCGLQGARGENRGGDFFVENVFEELDSPGAR